MKPQPLIPAERIQRAIFLVRGEKVLLDADLAALYGVTTGNLNKAVKRNLDRFPDDFMFELTAEEAENLRCQIGISSSYGGRRYLPRSFAEQSVAMLSSVLRSQRRSRPEAEFPGTGPGARAAVPGFDERISLHSTKPPLFCAHIQGRWAKDQA